jgi:DNA (cytosine-5)-methyltransferase 1
MPYDISRERREEYRRTSLESQARKKRALVDRTIKPIHPVNVPRFDPADLMPKLPAHGLRALSLFSGGGGLDLGFEYAGFEHVAAYEILEICGDTLARNRPDWEIHVGEQGDVEREDWKRYADSVDVIHGGPPCQPFSIAGKQKGAEDERNMWPAFIKAIKAIRPRAFVAENVTGLLDPKFYSYVEETIEKPIRSCYQIFRFTMGAEGFGVPQSRKRVFFVGIRDRKKARFYRPPSPTHTIDEELALGLQRCVGAREALGLPNIGFDWIAPTLRSGFTGPRKTTGVINSKASLELWDKLEIWPHGVQPDRLSASLFPPENMHFRLSTQDCAILQGFPAAWTFVGAVYQQLGQIGNSVCPPVGYSVATSLVAALSD